ncbi:hypothetical protein LPW11_11685 [Geomonas sp. RF6]|uniref:hypothetical protein n=1 Tax=Geomonas sp. RF6 TaxID=2897342 RepID=UPI001E300399|nr:hypothetical protein [Geomonas sp. RF6]UFS68578.1 hypothetical protein LPW11_11685 [Geomonas sp. RF6]
MQESKERGHLRRPFVIVGALFGAALSGWYLYHHAAAPLVVPDPVWLRFVNVALIMFCTIYVANLLRRVVERGRK